MARSKKQMSLLEQTVSQGVQAASVSQERQRNSQL